MTWLFPGKLRLEACPDGFLPIQAVTGDFPTRNGNGEIESNAVYYVESG